MFLLSLDPSCVCCHFCFRFRVFFCRLCCVSLCDGQIGPSCSVSAVSAATNCNRAGCTRFWVTASGHRHTLSPAHHTHTILSPYSHHTHYSILMSYCHHTLGNGRRPSSYSLTILIPYSHQTHIIPLNTSSPSRTNESNIIGILLLKTI